MELQRGKQIDVGTDRGHGSLLRSAVTGAGRKQESRGVQPGPGSERAGRQHPGLRAKEARREPALKSGSRPRSPLPLLLRTVVPNSLTLWTAARQAPPSMGFSRQEH